MQMLGIAQESARPEGASVFWLREVAALPNEERSIASWEIKRDGTRRGLVEIIGD